MKLARLFAYTLQLEQRYKDLTLTLRRERALRESIETSHHAEFDALRNEIVGERIVRAGAESAASVLREELERAHRWIDKLSDQNFDLTDRLCLKANVPPTSEPLRRGEAAEPSIGEMSDLLDRSVRRTGPVATARQDAEQRLRDRRAREEESRQVRLPGPLAAAAANEGVADVVHT